MVDHTTTDYDGKPGADTPLATRPVVLAFVLAVPVLVLVSTLYFLKDSPAVSASPQADQSLSGAQTTDAVDGTIVPVSRADNPVISIATDLGRLKIELYPEYAPTIVADLLKLVEDNYFDEGVLLESRQGVGFVIAKINGDVHDFGTVDAEYNSIRSARGSVAIAINDKNNAYLNNIFVGYQHQPDLQQNYRIFGQVLEGVDAIEKRSIARRGVIESVSVVK
jgi:cyclophilin family peptidyl-prolyl cis-trans isomerase